jgi:hypothetical protein
MPPLDLDLNSVDTSMPLIHDNEVVDFRIDKIEKKKTKDGKADMLAITHKSLSPTRGVKDETLQPGVMVFNNVVLAPTGKATWDMVLRNIAALTQAAGCQMSLGDFINGGFMTLQGATVRAKVAYTAEGPDKTGVVRRAKNEIGLYIKP